MCGFVRNRGKFPQITVIFALRGVVGSRGRNTAAALAKFPLAALKVLREAHTGEAATFLEQDSTTGQNERLAKFGTVVESCSKKVAASSVLASVNTFSAASEDFAKVTAIFLSLIPTNQQKGKWTLICRNPPSFLTTPRKPE